MRAALPERPLNAHKYSAGKVFVIAGSRKFAGVPVMCALAAMKAGAGAVILGTPLSLQPVLTRKLTEVILEPLEETTDGTVSRASLDRIRDRAHWADVVVIGPGLSRNEETDSVVLQLLEELTLPVVLDADGLTAAAFSPEVLRRRKAATILTPHAGELGRLLGKAAADIERDRLESARVAAKRFKCIVVLKGAPTVTAVEQGSVYVNTTGNPGMATIGTGDILTGIISSFWAQGMEPVAASYGGVFLHGRAGDLAAARLGERSLLALDLADHLAPAFLSLSR